MKFENAGVKVFGFNGKAKDAVENLLKNNLKEIENCHDHNDHNHKCH
jgi:predicted Fe-Mo cluster-binding NifX family protein